MTYLIEDIATFFSARDTEWARSRQIAALQIICGVDLSALEAANVGQRAAALARIDRLLERERLRGLAGHWSYDLNRHIALKQAVDGLKNSQKPGAGMTSSPTKNGARRRRRVGY